MEMDVRKIVKTWHDALMQYAVNETAENFKILDEAYQNCVEANMPFPIEYYELWFNK